MFVSVAVERALMMDRDRSIDWLVELKVVFANDRGRLSVGGCVADNQWTCDRSSQVLFSQDQRSLCDGHRAGKGIVLGARQHEGAIIHCITVVALVDETARAGNFSANGQLGRRKWDDDARGVQHDVSVPDAV